MAPAGTQTMTRNAPSVAARWVKRKQGKAVVWEASSSPETQLSLLSCASHLALDLLWEGDNYRAKKSCSQAAETKISSKREGEDVVANIT